MNIRISVFIVLLCLNLSSTAGELLMMRSSKDFPETMLIIQDSLKSYGYTVSRVQRVDIGLSKSHYQTDKYRIVFFGKSEEVSHIKEKYPDLVPFLPLQILLFAEETQTLVMAVNPSKIAEIITVDEIMKAQLMRWENDLRAILTEIATTEY